MGGCLKLIFIQPFILLWEIIRNLFLLLLYLIPILLIWLAFNYFSWGNLDFLPNFSMANPFTRQTVTTAAAPATPAASSAPTAAQSYAIIFRFLWQGEDIYYLGNLISEDYFFELAEQAKDLNGLVEAQQAADVSDETAARRVNRLAQIGVAYRIIVLE
jgi:hypothetical protein